MRLYLNKKKIGTAFAVSNKIDGFEISNRDSLPYVKVPDCFDIRIEEGLLKDYFVKATFHAFPLYESPRELGTYHFGKSVAELTKTQNAPYVLKIETLYWLGIFDMKTLQERLWAGTISPDASYAKKQSSNIIGSIRAFISKCKKRAWCKEMFSSQRERLSPGLRQKSNLKN